MRTDRTGQLEFHGHRGARGLSPENTLASIERALAIGVSAVEVDVALTADGVLVVHHDPRLHPDHTRDRHGEWLHESGPALIDVAYADLLVYDVGRLRPGSVEAGRFPEQEPSDGARIPTLDDVVDRIEHLAGEAVAFNIEIKHDPVATTLSAPPTRLAAAVADVVARRGIASRSMVQSFDWAVVAAVHALDPGIRTACLTAATGLHDTLTPAGAEPSPWTGRRLAAYGDSVPAMVAAFGAPVWNPFHHDLTAPAVADAHERGLKVLTWTVNEADEMARLIAMGVDGITTDYPDRLRAVAAASGLALPPPFR